MDFLVQIQGPAGFVAAETHQPLAETGGLVRGHQDPVEVAFGGGRTGMEVFGHQFRRGANGGDRIVQVVRQPGADRRLPRAPVPPADADLVAEDLATLLREWSGHEFQSTRDACLAEALAYGDTAVRSLAAGHADWLAAALSQPDMARAAGVNTHGGHRWLGKEDLEALLQVMMIEALAREPDTASAVAPVPEAADRPTTPMPAPVPVPVAARLTALLDARALILKSAAEAGYRVDKLITALIGPDPS